MPILSICIIIKDEVKQLPRLFREWEHPDVEIVLVDTGSTDGSVEYLNQNNISFYKFPWVNDFSEARNESLKHAKAPWIMWLDADDHLDVGDLNKICNALGNLNSQKAFSLRIENPIQEGEGHVFNQLRIFPNHLEIEFRGAVHEELSSSLEEAGVPSELLSFAITHKGYFHKQDRDLKSIRNHEILEKEFHKKPKDPFVLMELGNSFYQKNEFQKAITFYQKAIEYRVDKKGSSLDSLEMLLGNVYLKLKDEATALELFNKSIESGFDYLGPYFETAKIHLQRGNVAKAENLFLSLIKKGDVAKNMAESVKSLRLNSFGFLGLINFVNKKYPEALVYLQKGYDVKLGASVDPWLYIEVCFHLDNKQEARKWMNTFDLEFEGGKLQEIQSWIKEVDVVYSRPDQEKVIKRLLTDLNDEESWKTLKKICEKFDNWERSLERLSHLSGVDISQIREISQRIIHVKSSTG